MFMKLQCDFCKATDVPIHVLCHEGIPVMYACSVCQEREGIRTSECKICGRELTGTATRCWEHPKRG